MEAVTWRHSSTVRTALLNLSRENAGSCRMVMTSLTRPAPALYSRVVRLAARDCTRRSAREGVEVGGSGASQGESLEEARPDSGSGELSCGE